MTTNLSGGRAAWFEANDQVGGNGSFAEAARAVATCTGGTSGNCEGMIGVGIASVAYNYIQGFEGQIFNNSGTDATTTFSSAKFASPYLATSLGANKADAGYITNPFSTTPFLSGYYVAAASVSDTAFRSDAALVHLLDGSRGTCSSTCIAMPGFTVGSSGITAVNLNAAAAPTPTTSGFNVAGADGAGAGYGVDTFAGVGAVVFRRANTTNSAPSKLLSGDQIGQMSWRGWDNSGVYSNNQAVLRVVAAEDWNDATHRGTSMTFNVTPAASATITQAGTFFASGGFGVGSAPTDVGAGGIFATDLYSSDATFLVRTKTTLTNSAAANTATMTNAPAVGNPTKWFAIDDNGTSRKIPAW